MKVASAEGRNRVARGDWQTPPALAAWCVSQLKNRGLSPAAVLEPSCGDGAFLLAAAHAFPDAALVGFDIDEGHLARARARLAGRACDLTRADFFDLDWDAIVSALPQPFLLLGNPPWVTAATQGRIGQSNRPPREVAHLKGLEARTGSSNFDISTWLLGRLVRAGQGKNGHLAMLCKTRVARRLFADAHRDGVQLQDGELLAIDAKTQFGASVSAVLTVAKLNGPTVLDRWRMDDHSEGCVDGVLVSDVDAALATRAFTREAPTTFRSGVKHDAQDVFELRHDGEVFRNGFGEAVDVEETCLFPLRKARDLIRDEAPRRALVVTQRALGDDPRAVVGPRALAYLERHERVLGARRSSIYRGRPPFAMFGVGPYTFQPWKVAIAALGKELKFTCVGPSDGRPMVFDDTCYFAPFASEKAARKALKTLSSDGARRYFEARIFWDEKRPIRKSVLDSFGP